MLPYFLYSTCGGRVPKLMEDNLKEQKRDSGLKLRLLRISSEPPQMCTSTVKVPLREAKLVSTKARVINILHWAPNLFTASVL